MARESIQKKIGRVRPPRVHITYDVEIGGAIQLKEIPFVVGVLADLSGKPDEPLPALKDRKFVEIDRDNFNAVLKAIQPRLAYRVDNKLGENDTKQAKTNEVTRKFLLEEELQKEEPLLDKIISESRIARSEIERSRAKDLI